MATALLIGREDLVSLTALGGNVDPDKFIQFIKIAQDIHVQNYLGTKLLEKLQTEIVAGTLSGDYLSLVNTYVKPMLIHFAMVEYLPFVAYTIANGGIFKHSPENTTTVEKNEVDFLIEKERSIAQNYTERFIDYISFNQGLFPEYYQNTNGDVYADSRNNNQGWYL